MRIIKVVGKWVLFLLTVLVIAFAFFMLAAFVVSKLNTIGSDWLIWPVLLISILLGGYLAALLWNKELPKCVLQAMGEKLIMLLKTAETRIIMLSLFLVMLLGAEAYFVMPKWEYIKAAGNYLKCNRINGKCFSEEIERDDDGLYFSETEIRPKRFR